jgi:hypothetical protein
MEQMTVCHEIKVELRQQQQFDELCLEDCCCEKQDV